ncbi:MAG: putative nucleotidyltransferase substrate binding domain-containing protein [Marmoricola sp.]
MQEFIDFLGKQAPYDRLEADDLERLARAVEVDYYPAGATIVEADGPKLSHLFVIRTGRAEVGDRGRVVDELGPGDTFGHISVLSGLPPALSVTATADTVCYRIPDPRSILANPKGLTFSHYGTMVGRNRLLNLNPDRGSRLVSDLMRSPIWCTPLTPIREAAARMTSENHSCVLYRTPDGVGIMTDSDCRSQVATGQVSIDAPVSAIGTAKVESVPHDTTSAEAFVRMVTRGVHHLVVEDEQGEAFGVTRVVDLSSADIRDPLMVRSAIDRADDLDTLAAAGALLRPSIVELYDAGVPALRASAILAAIVEAMAEKCVALEPAFDSETGLPLSASWLVLGSLARREPLPQSDIDTGLVWEAHEEALNAERPKIVLDAAERVITALERCGLERCPDGANAFNPLFNRSRFSWEAAINHWLTHPDGEGSLLLSAIVTDSRAITGLSIGRRLEGFIKAQTAGHDYLSHMLHEALASRPPTGFVRDFVVEAEGEHKGELNLKKRGLAPVVGIGRWIAVAARLPISSTQERLESGAQAGLLTRDEADTLKGSHEEMFELLFEQEIEALRDGRAPSTYLNPQHLDSLARRHLRESFRAIAAVQSNLEAQWVSRMR